MGNDARNLINSCVNAKLKLIEKDGDEKVCKGMIELMGTERREGMKEGMKTQLQLAISSMRKKGMDVKDIAYYLEISEEEVRNIGVIGQ